MPMLVSILGRYGGSVVGVGRTNSAFIGPTDSMRILSYGVEERSVAVVAANGRNLKFRQAYFGIESDRLVGEPSHVHFRLHVRV